MKRLPIVVAGLAASLLCCFAALAQAPSTAKTRSAGPFVRDGIETPVVREIDLEGLKKLLQRDPKDTRPLLINFWATWCESCREEFPDLVKIDGEYKGKGLNFVAISLDDATDVKTKVLPFLKDMKATMSQVLLKVPDQDLAIHAVDPTWDGVMPATFLFNSEGKIVFKVLGPIKPAELRAAIDTQVGSAK